MAKVKKPKINFKDLLLQKGEYLALGIGGAGLLVLLFWGVSTALSAKPPETAVKSFNDEANRMKSRLAAPEIPPDEKEKIEQELRLAEWKSIVTGKFAPVPPEEFVSANNLFDPIGRPDTKWEIPQVLAIKEAQVDLVRAPMKGYDIIYEGDGKARIAILEAKKTDKLDEEKLRDALAASGGRPRGVAGSIPRTCRTSIPARACLAPGCPDLRDPECPASAAAAATTRAASGPRRPSSTSRSTTSTRPSRPTSRRR